MKSPVNNFTDGVENLNALDAIIVANKILRPVRVVVTMALVDRELAT